MNDLVGLAEKNGYKTIGIFIAVAAGVLVASHFIHQIRLARLQIEKTREEIKDLKDK